MSGMVSDVLPKSFVDEGFVAAVSALALEVPHDRCVQQHGDADFLLLDDLTTDTKDRSIEGLPG